MNILIIQIVILTGTMLVSGCQKDDACYSAELEEKSSGACPQDCPGVCGCDGEFYCNTCIANSHGVHVVSGSNCK